jgi:hypothetical protein
MLGSRTAFPEWSFAQMGLSCNWTSSKMATPFKFQLQESPHELRDWNQHIYINRSKWVWLQPDLTSLCRLKDLLSRLEMLGIERQTWITALRITHILTAMFQTFDAWDGGSHTKPRNVKTCGVSAAPETGLELSHLIRGQGGALLILRCWAKGTEPWASDQKH